MRRIVASIVLIVIALFNASSSGQETKRNGEDETCSGPVYDRKEVTHPAKVRLPDVEVTDEARTKGQTVLIIVTAVLCRTGRVTDIRVVKGSPDEMTKRVVEALRKMKFTPAEKDGQEVSQRLRAEFEFKMY